MFGKSLVQRSSFLNIVMYFKNDLLKFFIFCLFFQDAQESYNGNTCLKKGTELLSKQDQLLWV